MRPPLDMNRLRRFLPLIVFSIPAAVADETPVPNEINSKIEEPLIYLPEAGASSPFHSASQPRTISPNSDDAALIKLAEEAVDSTRRRLLSVETNSPWQIMHGLLALRRDFQLKKNDQVISGLDWVSSGPSYEGEAWFERTQYGGRAHPYSRPWAFEGHANQFLAILSMSALPVDHQFQTPTGPITIADMVEHAQKVVNVKDEPTWTLWALSRYLPPDAAWRNVNGESWSIERLVSIQTAKPLQGSACGGTHGLFAIAHARNVYLRSGQPLRGVWLDAEYKIRRHISIARVQQNSNGMLSSNFFRGREYKQDFNKRMASAGHILEFLMIALPQDELKEPWVRRAIKSTSEDLLRNRKAFVKCSPLYHAVNALNIYLDRVRPASDAVALTTDEGELMSVDADAARKLKRVPGTSISDTKVVMKEQTPKDGVTTDMMPATPESELPLEADDVRVGEPSEKDVAPGDDDTSDKVTPEVSAAGKSESKGWKKATQDDTSNDKVEEPTGAVESKNADAAEDEVDSETDDEPKPDNPSAPSDD